MACLHSRLWLFRRIIVDTIYNIVSLEYDWYSRVFKVLHTITLYERCSLWYNFAWQGKTFQYLCHNLKAFALNRYLSSPKFNFDGIICGEIWIRFNLNIMTLNWSSFWMKLLTHSNLINFNLESIQILGDFFALQAWFLI